MASLQSWVKCTCDYEHLPLKVGTHKVPKCNPICVGGAEMRALSTSSPWDDRANGQIDVEEKSVAEPIEPLFGIRWSPVHRTGAHDKLENKTSGIAKRKAN